MIYYDAHVHLALDGMDYNRMKDLCAAGPDISHVRNVLDAYKKAGFVFLRDGGDKWGMSSLAKKLAPEYGIDYRFPGFAIYKKGSYGSILGRPFENFDEFKGLVCECMEAGCDFIKIMASGIMDFNEYGRISPCTLEAEEIKDMIAFCHDKGMSVMAHCNGNENLIRIIDAGADSIEHGYYMDQETLQMIKEKDIVWVPTVIPVSALAGQPGFDEGVIKRILEKHIENIHTAAKMGIHLAPGSDGGSFLVLHARGSLKEYALLSDILKEEVRSASTLDDTYDLIKTRFKRA